MYNKFNRALYGTMTFSAYEKMKVNDELEKWLDAIPQEKELLLSRKRGYSLPIQNCFAESELVPLRALGAQFWQQTEVITELRMHELIVLYRFLRPRSPAKK